MKERSISHRNFVGAFLGGVLGVIAFGYLHPATLPLGCLSGVVIGWWYQEIWRTALDSFYRSLTRCRETLDQALDDLRCLWDVPTQILERSKPGYNRLLKALNFLWFLVFWLPTRPRAFRRWLGAHPMNRAYTIRTLSVLAFLTLESLWAIPLIIYFFKAGSSAPKDSLIALPYMGGLILTIVVAFLAPLVRLDRSDSPRECQRNFYSDWESYASRGGLRFFGLELLFFFGWTVAIFLAISAVLIWYSIVGGLFLTFIVLPLSLGIGLVKGIFRASVKTGHWLCFGTTLVVTIMAAWIAYPYVADPRILWLTALSSGLVSALATEGLRRSVLWCFEANEKLRLIESQNIWLQLRPAGQKFQKLTAWMTDTTKVNMPA